MYKKYYPNFYTSCLPLPKLAGLFFNLPIGEGVSSWLPKVSYLYCNFPWIYGNKIGYCQPCTNETKISKINLAVKLMKDRAKFFEIYFYVHVSLILQAAPRIHTWMLQDIANLGAGDWFFYCSSIFFQLISSYQLCPTLVLFQWRTRKVFSRIQNISWGFYP